jgi:hypothetical protein
LCSSPNIISVIKLKVKNAGRVAHIGEVRNAYKILVRRLEGEKPLGRPRDRW